MPSSPETIRAWGEREAGDKVNIEVDQMPRAPRCLWRRAGPLSKISASLRVARTLSGQAPVARALRVHEVVAVQCALDLLVSSAAMFGAGAGEATSARSEGTP